MSDIPDTRPNFALPGWIQPGDVAHLASQGRHRFAFDPYPGRYIALCFCPDWDLPCGRQTLAAIQALGGMVESGKAVFFAVLNQPADSLRHDLSAIRPLHDPEREMNRAYGVGATGVWIVLNPMLRVVAVIDFHPDGSDRDQLARLLADLPPPSRFLGLELAAPILVLSDVIEPALCRHLVACFERNGGRPSGFMQEVDGAAVESFDPAWKRRRDLLITDPDLVRDLRARIGRRVAPEIQKAFAFTVTRIERELVGCYRADESAHFGPHRDDTIGATAHRRFAVSINLNDDFDGGMLTFPEFGPNALKAPVGAAVVFSCALLHQVGRVTRGARYAFLPFLFDEAAERLRQEHATAAAPDRRQG